MTKFLKLAGLLLFFLLFSQTVGADFEKSGWAFSKEIRLQPVESKKVATFALDNEVFDNAKGDLGDLRIIDSNNRETPYKLTIEESKALSGSFPVKITNLGSKPGEFTQLTLDLGRAGEVHNRLVLSTNSINFRRQVEVEASSDGQNWFLVKKAGEGGHIYDYSVDFKAQNTTVSYPDSTFRYLRVKIIDNGEEPIKVTGAAVSRNVVQGAREVFYSPKVVEKGNDKDKRSNFYILDLEARGIPSNKIIFSTSDENFNRQIEVLGSNDKQNWSQILGQDVIFGYNTPKFSGLKNTINYPESNLRYLKLVVFNRDNEPIMLSGFKVSGILRKILFQAEPGVGYNLYFGNAKARFAEYDLENFIQYLDTANPAEGVLGPKIANANFKGETPRQVPLTERYPYLLAGVLGVLVLILGTMVFKMAFAVKSGRR